MAYLYHKTKAKSKYPAQAAGLLRQKKIAQNPPYWIILDYNFPV
jgi:hypothetical protein